MIQSAGERTFYDLFRSLFVVVQQAETSYSEKRSRPFRKSSSTANPSPAILPPNCFTQLYSRLHRAARSQQVVDQHHTLTRLDCIHVDFERVEPYSRVVRYARHGAGSLPRLAHRNKSSIQPISERRAKDKPARLDAQHQVDSLFNVVRRERINQLRKSRSCPSIA